jgi:hypothetical protein
MDALSPRSRVQTVVVMKGAQIGASEFMLNVMGFHLKRRAFAHPDGPAHHRDGAPLQPLMACENATRASEAHGGPSRRQAALERIVQGDDWKIVYRGGLSGAEGCECRKRKLAELERRIAALEGQMAT